MSDRLPVEEVREIDVNEIAERLGIEVNRAGFAACVEHPDSGRPNMKVYDNGVYCFRCNFRADGIGLAEHVLGVDFAEAVLWLADDKPFDGELPKRRKHERREVVSKIDLPLNRLLWSRFVDLAHARLAHGRSAWNWLADRGLAPSQYGPFKIGAVTESNQREIAAGLRDFASVDVLRDASLLSKHGGMKFKNRVIFPFIRGGEVVGFQGRTIDNTPPKYMGPHGCTLPLFNVDVIKKARRMNYAVWVCEGPIDTIAVTQSGRAAVGLPGVTSINAADLVNFAGLTVVLCLDADDAGREATPRLIASINQAGAKRIFTVQLPEGTDAAEWDWSKGRPPVAIVGVDKEVDSAIFRVRGG